LSDVPAETPRIARAYCPACEPDADALLEILEVQWCNAHTPMREGVDDARVMSDAMLTGSAEAGGDENRRWCDVIHGDHNRRRRGRQAAHPPTPYPQAPHPTLSPEGRGD
jgi:hypothetical protein